MTMIEVIEQCSWQAGVACMPGQERIGQLTKAKVTIAGEEVVFYVRENLDGRQSFYISSNERMEFKEGRGNRKSRMRRQCLDLCAPDEHWEKIAELVRAADEDRRSVRGNRTFTKTWAEAQLFRARRQDA